MMSEVLLTIMEALGHLVGTRPPADDNDTAAWETWRKKSRHCIALCAVAFFGAIGLLLFAYILL